MATEEKKLVFELLVGDVVARSVFSRDGHVLLDPETRLSEDLIGKLERWGVDSVFIKADAAPAPQSGDAAITIESDAEKPSDAFTLMLGSLESEEPIAWEEHAEKEPPPREIEKLAEKIEERLAEPPPVRRKRERVPPPPENFVYDKKVVREAKQVMHEAHRRAVKEIRSTFSSVVARHPDMTMENLRRTIIHLVDNGVSNRPVLCALTALTHFDDHLLAHAVASTVHAVLTGHTLGYDREELYELAECSLLHDIGMSRISSKVWKHPGRLALPMQLEIQKHTILGADTLHETQGISRHAEYVAYQHHERFDGSGYPKGRKGSGIHEYARIVGLVDTYAAMTAPRPHRDRILGYDTMKHIIASSATLFDPVVVKAFLQNMALYPVGSLVELTNGSVGLVVAANPLFPYRPQVKITRDERGIETQGDGDVIDLVSVRALGIVRPLPTPTEMREKVWEAL